MSPKPHQRQEVGRIVEGQMRQWEITKDGVHAHLASGAEIDYITISRETGSGGEEVAQILADLMKWQLYDKGILDYMSENMQVHKSVLESVDERTIGWMEDWLGPIFTKKSTDHVDQLSYYRHLVKVLLVIAKHANAVIVGRAAGQVLPRDKGLSVRVTAPFELRCKRYAEEHRISGSDATTFVRKADKEQIRFVKNFANKDINDPKDYDIVCNTEKLSPTSVAKLIWRAFDQRIVSEQQQADTADAPKD